MMTDEQVGKDLKGSSNGLIRVSIQYFPETTITTQENNLNRIVNVSAKIQTN
jgi:hypothetical protein